MIFDSILKNVRCAMEEDQIRKNCEQFCNYIGFDNYLVFGSVFHTMIHPPSITISNIGNPAKLKRNDYFPLVEDALNHTTPIISANLKRNSPLNSHIGSAISTTRRGTSRNHIGINFPVHFPSGRFALLYVKTRADEEDYSDLIMNVMVSGNQFAREIGTAALRVLEYNLGNDIPYLSAREKECLLLASDGYTPKEISQHLELSTHTVLFHLKKARKKLTSKNLQGAISKAMMSGDVKAKIDTKRRLVKSSGKLK